MTAEELSRLLDELGERLGPAGSHVFELAVRQVYITAGMGLLTGLVLLVAAPTLLIVGRRYYRAAVARYEAKNNGYAIRPDIDGFAMAWGGLSVACALGAVFFLGASVPAFLNPEYAAIRDLLGAIR